MSRLVVAAPFLFGVLLAVPGALGMAGRLPKNDWVGIRMDVVMRDRQSWLVAHRAGGPWLLAGGLVGLATGVALVVTRPDASAAGRLCAGSLVVSLVLATVGAWRGQSAARRGA